MKKHLLSFILLIVFIKANCQTYSAGIPYSVYHDINPDQQLHYVYFPFTHQVYDIDIFGDSQNDIEFIADGSSSPGGSSAYINIRSLNPNVYIAMGRLDSVYDSTSSSWLVTNVAKALLSGATINGPSTVWNNGMLYLTDNSASFGWSKHVTDFVSSGDRFIGLKYQNGTISTYGWLRVFFPEADSAFVRDYSYAGDVSIRERTAEKINVFPNPVTSRINIANMSGNTSIDRIELISLTGDCVNFNFKTEKDNIQLDLNDDIPPGCYFLKCYTNKEVIVKRIIKVNG